jgi:spermidine synthase
MQALVFDNLQSSGIFILASKRFQFVSKTKEALKRQTFEHYFSSFPTYTSGITEQNHFD